MTILRTAAIVAFLAAPGASFASSIVTVTLGDEDCFGRNETPCNDGTSITAPTAGFDAAGILPFPTEDLSTALDPAGTDVFGELGPLDFTFTLDLTGQDISNVSVNTKVWGLDLFASSPANGGTFGDAFEGARFQLNGADIGTHFSAAGPGPNLVEELSFAVDPSVLITGDNVLTITPEQDFLQFASAFFTGEDAFAVDFVSLMFTSDPRVTPPPTSVVPLPAGLPLMVGGLAMLGALRRRRKT